MKADFNLINKFNDCKNKTFIEDLEIKKLNKKFQEMSASNNKGNNLPDTNDEKLNIVELPFIDDECLANPFDAYTATLETIDESDEVTIPIITPFTQENNRESHSACKIPLAGDNSHILAIDFMCIDSHG
jgi:hypothetical protein